MPTNPKLTTLGTPCARSWTNDWIAAVDAKESELNHRICGARLPDATPCCNTSNHPSGRCQFHGGFDLTGAPPGNRNHVIHGLYSRRLRPCAPDCPLWENCPVANTHAPQDGRHPRENGDPSSYSARRPHPRACPGEASSGARESADPSSYSHTSDPTDPSDPSDSSDSPHPPNPKPPQSPPTCVYQLTEYNTVLSDALAIVESQPHPNSMGIHTAHNVAMLQVLINTAATHLARASSPCSPSPVSRASSPCSSQDPYETPNPNAILAFTRLMREFRANLKLLYAQAHTPLNRQRQNDTPPSPEGILRHAQRIQHDTGLDPDSQAAAQLPPQTPETHAKAYIQRAALTGGQGHDVEMCEAFDSASLIDEAYAESERDRVLASYRPAKQSVSEELAELILGNLHLPPLTKNEEGDPTTTHAPNEPEISPESAKILQNYLDLFRDGKIPPEAFPIGSPKRALAEAIFTGPPTTTPKLPDSGALATPKPTSEGGSM